MTTSASARTCVRSFASQVGGDFLLGDAEGIGGVGRFYNEDAKHHAFADVAAPMIFSGRGMKHAPSRNARGE